MFARARLVGVLLVFGFSLFSATGCNTQSNGSGEAGHAHGPIAVDKSYAGKYPINVACKTGLVAALVRNVGGDKVRIVQLMGEGVDPHLYKASTGDVKKLNDADIIFYSGLHLEGKMADVFVRMARKKPTFAVTEYIEENRV